MKKIQILIAASLLCCLMLLTACSPVNPYPVTTAPPTTTATTTESVEAVAPTENPENTPVSSDESAAPIEANLESDKVPTYRKISPEEAAEMLKNDPQIILLDVRTEEEYAEKHIPNSILVPDDQVVARANTTFPDKNAVILVYCRSGRRSEGAAKALVKLGYNNVYDFGGINDWPYETEPGS